MLLYTAREVAQYIKVGGISEINKSTISTAPLDSVNHSPCFAQDILLEQVQKRVHASASGVVLVQEST
jgi:hypothetical protein